MAGLACRLHLINPDDVVTGDEDLVRRLAGDKFQGPEFDLFNETLVIYGYAICLAWINSGRMIRECRDRHRPVGDFPRSAVSQDRQDLAIETAVEGSALFRKVALIEGRWSPSGGAALTTYYIGACIHTYPGVFRRWYRHHLAWQRVHGVDVLPEQEVDGPGESIPLKIVLGDVMKSLDEPMYIAMCMVADGYPQIAIARSLGCTPRAVETLLRKGRRRCRESFKRLGGRYE